MFFINELLDYWVSAPWFVALAMSAVVNIAIFVLTARLLELVVCWVAADKRFGHYIDDRDLRPAQRREEQINGVIACTIFAVLSLLTRTLFVQNWPSSAGQFALQIAAFVVFYETYSYFVHRLLHTRWFLKVHSVHHRSVRVTPWTAYSVHPVEAVFIGISAPLFMCFVPMSLGLILVLHVFGMMFTILLHSNLQLNLLNGKLKILTGYASYHTAHHLFGKVNYGFVHSFWDNAFKTGKQQP